MENTNKTILWEKINISLKDYNKFCNSKSRRDHNIKYLNEIKLINKNDLSAYFALNNSSPYYEHTYPKYNNKCPERFRSIIKTKGWLIFEEDLNTILSLEKSFKDKYDKILGLHSLKKGRYLNLKSFSIEELSFLKEYSRYVVKRNNFDLVAEEYIKNIEIS